MRTLFGVVVVALSVMVGAATMTSRASADVHFALIKSAPADDVTLQTPPTSIELWFSEEPDLAGTRIRLLNHRDEMIETGKVMRSAEAENMVHAAVEGGVSRGSYRILWRGMARDGHVLTGELTFEMEEAR